MKFTSKQFLLSKVFLLSVLLLVQGCGGPAFPMEYTTDSTVSSYRMLDIQDEIPYAEPFAGDLCVVGDHTAEQLSYLAGVSSAALFSIEDSDTIYAQNVHQQLAPASLTKIMTALVAIKHSANTPPDTLITASENVLIGESGAQVCGIRPGDQLTLDQALHLMLINSANDAAIVVAEGVAGSVEAFNELMNAEALSLGATNTHFTNPHGLSDENHYSTVYDLYLILNEAIKFDIFNQIIMMDQYTTVITTESENDRELSVRTTNLYLQGEQQPPEQITVLGGKTGTTNAAGHCLALVTRNTAGKTYISIILRSESRDEVYGQMTRLLGEID